MDLSKLELLLNKGEGPKLDYKEMLDLETESDKKELVKDVIAIANSQGGRGHLIIGVKDKTKDIVGIDSNNINEERIQQIIGSRCDPPVNIRVEFFNIEEKTVSVITIFRSRKKPHQMLQTGAFYIRRGSTTDVARRDEIANMFQKSGVINNELIPVYNVGIDVLDKTTIEKYIEKITSNHEYDELILSNLGIIHMDEDSNNYCPTVGGLLLFCKNPQIYLPHTGLKLIYEKEDEEIAEKFNGNILEILDNSTEFLTTLLDKYNYPMGGLNECLSNALIHRDYFDYKREIVVNISRSAVEISNPGSVSYNDRINNMISERNPFRRNNWLYQRILVLDDKGRFIKTGTGLNRIKNAFEGWGKVKFISSAKKNYFKVVLPGIYKGK